MAYDPTIGYLLGRGMARAVKARRFATGNPVSDWFFGIAHDAQEFDASDNGLTKAYLASLWAYRCITLRGKKVSEIPLHVKTHDDQFVDQAGRPVDELSPILARQHILQRFLSSKYARSRRLLEYDLCIWGRGFLDPTRRGLMRLNPTTMFVEKDNQGIKEIWQQLNGQRVAQWKPYELCYIYDFDPADDLNGLSPLAFALDAIGSEVSVDTFVKAFFENDATPAGLLTTEAPMSDEQITNIQGWWKKFFGGIANKFKVGIVGSGLKFEPLASDIANLAIPDMRTEIRREVCAAFGVPMTIAGADEAANYSTSYEQHLAFYTETIIPEVQMIVAEMNRQLVPRFDRTGRLKIVADLSDISVLQKFKSELSQARSSQFQAGTMTVNEARVADGLPPFDDDYIVVQNIGMVKVDDLPKIADRTANPPAEPAGPSFGSSDIPEDFAERPEVPVLPPPRAEAVTPMQRAHVGSYSVMPGRPSVQPTRSVGREAYVCLALPNDNLIADIQSLVRAAVGNDPVDWSAPERWHVTLVYGENVPDSALGNIGRQIEIKRALQLQPVGVTVLDNGTEPALVIELEKSRELKAWQRGIYDLFAERSIPVSRYSKPASYRPHITIGTVKPGFDVDELPEITSDPLEATTVQVSRPDYFVIRESRAAAGTAKGLIVPSVRNVAARAEIKKWRSKVRVKGHRSPFESDVIPSAVMTFLRWDLENSEGDEAEIKSAFEKALETLQSADLEEFNAFWDGIDKSADDLVTGVKDIIADPTIAQRLADHVEQTANPETAQLFFDTLAEEQVDKLLGTEENPGPLARIFMSGAARGQEFFDRLQEANKPPPPKRHATKQKVEIGTTWRMLGQDAWNWARSYAFNLVKGMNQTTAGAFQTAMTDWIARGGSLPGLMDMLRGRVVGLDIPKGWSPKKIEWATSDSRVRTIAQTESTRAFARGNERRWDTLGVKQIRYRTQRDRIVCPMCRAMNGAIGDLVNGFPVPATFQTKYGAYVKLPSHVGCRCFHTPIARSRRSPMEAMDVGGGSQRQTGSTIAVGPSAVRT